IQLHVPFGGRVVILGQNGSGKSTLLKTIAGALQQLEGKVVVGRGLVIGDLMQEHDNLPREASLKEFLTTRAGVSVQDAFALAAQHGFTTEEIDKKVALLSPGGRARLLFAAFTAMSVNALLLDEPTNHLDLRHQVRILEMLAGRAHRPGHLNIFVLHDVNLAARFGTHGILLFDDGECLHGPLSDVLARPNLERLYHCRLREIHADGTRWYLPD
ncbi:MAG: ATP-binding cassette domain-containing protein, partial [Sulfuricaulis sp.]|nr:ATP-binding cassette domain-containing protein [Sulfuricaulis sp.]